MNLVQANQINSKISYTPSTASNSCLNGFIVDCSTCEPNEKLRVKIKVEWSGFDNSNTAGTFRMFFQGSTHEVATNEFNWSANNMVTSGLVNKQNLTDLVLSATSGVAVIEQIVTVSSLFPTVRDKLYVGIRTDYSNGTGKITISELEVIKDKYYVNSETTELKIAEKYIVAKQFYEY